QQQWQQPGGIAQEVQRDVGQPGAQLAAEVLDVAGQAAGVRPARVVAVVRRQAGQQVDQGGDQQQQQDLAPQRAAAAGLGLLPGRQCAAAGFLGGAGHLTSNLKCVLLGPDPTTD